MPETYSYGGSVVAQGNRWRRVPDGIPVFASTADRDAHFAPDSPGGAPVVGQFAYLSDAGILQVWTGSQWVNYAGPGSEEVGPHEHDAAYVNVSGDKMTGLLVLSGDPTAPLGAVTKRMLESGLAQKSDASHDHDGTYAPAAHDHGDAYVTGVELAEAVAGKADADHAHDDRYYTEAESDAALAGKADRTHSHTGYAPSSHTHDDRYYTEAETDTALAGKSDVSHTHDGRYYTESEVDAKLAEVAGAAHDHDGDYDPAGTAAAGDAAHAAAADPHPQYLTQSEGDGRYSQTTHNHDSRYFTETESDARYLGKNDHLFPQNPFGGEGPKYSHLDNAAFLANERWFVFADRYRKSDDAHLGDDGNKRNLFDGSYDSFMSIDQSEYRKVTIDFGGPWSGYPYGYLYVSCYYINNLASVTGRIYTQYEPHGVGWHDLSFSDFQPEKPYRVLYARIGIYKIEKIELTLRGPDTDLARVSQIDWILDRPTSNPMPFVSKFRAETLYRALTLHGDPTQPLHAAPKQYVDQGLAGKAPSTHTHPTSQVTGLDSALAGKAPTSHTHNYAPVDHDHDADYVNVTGDTMTGPLDMGGNRVANLPDQTDPANPPDAQDAVTKAWVDGIGGKSAHGSLLGLDLDQHLHYAPIHVVQSGDPAPTKHQRKGQIVVRVGDGPEPGLGFVQTIGGTMTGPLLLAGNPANPMEAATKEYVDSLAFGGGTADASYTHAQEVPAGVWIVRHNLGKVPSVSVIDGGGAVVHGSVTHLDDNSLTVSFDVAITGTVVCN